MNKGGFVFEVLLLISAAAPFLYRFIEKTPEMNIAPYLMGFTMFFCVRYLSEKNIIAVTALASVYPWLLFTPGNIVSVQIAAGSFLFIWMCMFSAKMFAYDRKINSEKEEEVVRKKALLDSIREDGIITLQKEDEKVDFEIRNITSLYSAVKDLGQSLGLQESSENIMDIMKKITRYNFRINAEDINMILILKKGKEFKVSESYGYDEEFLEKAEKKIVSKILRNVAKNKSVVYKPTPDEDDKARMSFMKSLMFVPFYAEKRLLGVFFISGRTENMFDAKQVESMEILASQIAIALEKVYLYEEVQQMSILDGLTGLYVHRYLQEKMDNELKRASRYENDISVIMADIDFFKDINDTYGHLAGDYILKNIALLLKNNTTPADTVARYGGEEFFIVLPDSDKITAGDVAEKIRSDVEKYPFRFNDKDIKVTMSFGVASFPGDAIVKRSLIEKADKALYKAKESGRNMVVRA